MSNPAPASLRLFLGLAALSAAAPFMHAADGTWTFAGDGSWDIPGNWSGGTIANGAGFTATFEYGLPNAANSVISVDSDRIIGSLDFLGTAGTGTHNFTLNGPGTLTLAGTAPSISTSLASRDVTINTVLAGTQGLTLSNTGSGTVRLTLGGANTYTGLTQITAGVVTVAHNLAFGSTNGETTIVNNNAGIRLNDGIKVSGETLNLRGAGKSGTDGALTTATNASAEWAGNIRLNNGSSRFAAEGISAVLTVSGVISNGTTNNTPSIGNVQIANGNGATMGTVVFLRSQHLHR